MYCILNYRVEPAHLRRGGGSALFLNYLHHDRIIDDSGIFLMTHSQDRNFFTEFLFILNLGGISI